MQGTDGRDRPDVDIWKLVDYDPLCMNLTLLKHQIIEMTDKTAQAGKVGDTIMLLTRQLRECIYDKLERGGR